MLPKFEVYTPLTIKEAVSLANRDDNHRFFAGGTDLLVMMRENKVSIKNLIDIKNIPGIRGIDILEDGGLKIGATTTFREIINHPYILRNYPYFLDGMDRIGSVQIRNIATIGGNICNALPSADSAPILLVSNAKLYMENGEQKRSVPINEFFIDTRKTILASNEILTHIIVPPKPQYSDAAYIKYTRRKAMDLALFGVAVHLALDIAGKCVEARVALATSAPTPIRVAEAEEYLLGKLITSEVASKASIIAAEAVNPRTSYRATSAYRRQLIRTLTPRAIETVLKRIKEGEKE